VRVTPLPRAHPNERESPQRRSAGNLRSVYPIRCGNLTVISRAVLGLPRSRHVMPAAWEASRWSPRSPRSLRARRNDLDTDERWATIEARKTRPYRQ
jgi:hypothetical protein